MNSIRNLVQLVTTSVLILGIWFLPTVAGELPTLDQILERYVDVMGGREAIAKLEARNISGKQIDDRPYQGPPVESRLEAWADTTGDWTMTLQGSEGIHGDGSTAGETWAKKPGRPVEPNEHRNTKLAFLFNPQGPLMVENYFPNLQVTGTWDYDGVQYYQVENDLKFEYYTLYFEVETGMLTRIGYHWHLEGFRPVDGVMVPAKVFRGRKGGSTNLYFDTVSHGVDVKPYLRKGGNIVDE